MKLGTFFEKFELFADAPDAVTKMRELVLELAVRGCLFSSGNLDSSAPSSPFVIPQDWQWVALKEAADCRGAAKVDSTSLRDSDWVLDLEDIDGGAGKVVAMATFAERRSLSTKASFQKGDVLYGKLRPYLNKVVIADRPGFCTTEIIPLRPHKNVAAGYLRLFLRSPHFLRYAAAKNYGMKMPRLGTQDLESAAFPLPPLAEQKRIVAKVDELMALCDRLEAQQHEREEQASQLARASLARFADAPTPANLHFLFHPSYNIPPAGLRKSILTLAVQGKLVPQDPNDEPASESVRRLQIERKDLFEAEVIRASGEGIRPPRPPRNGFVPLVDEDNQDIPFNWCVTRVGDVSECLDYLRVPVNKGQRLAAIGTVPYYGANGQVGWIDNHLFDEDLVLVVEDETFIGRIKPFSYVIRGKSWVNNHAHVLRPLGGMTADFLNLVLCRYPFIPLTSGTTNRRKLTQPSLMDAKISLPPLAEQRRIVARVEQLMALVDALETQLAASRDTAENLLTSLVAELTTS